MPGPECLSELFLEQAPGCHWIVDAELKFRTIYGNSIPVFGKPPSVLRSRLLSDVLTGDAAAAWRERFLRALKGETLWLRLRPDTATWNANVFPMRGAEGTPFAGGSAREATRWTTAEQELRRTVLGALQAQEYSRTMASKFLHDTVGQNLTALGLQLDLVRMDLESISPEGCARIVDVQKVLEGVMERIREYTYELNPSAVERTGLRAALDRLIIRIRERFPGSLRVNVDPSLKLDPRVATALYHIAEEAIENAVQHSSCSAIEIAVKSTRSGPSLEVRDNGRGFDPADTLGVRRGLGLLSMEHYAAEAGLDLSIAGNRQTGTTVRASTPEEA